MAWLQSKLYQWGSYICVAAPKRAIFFSIFLLRHVKLYFFMLCGVLWWQKIYLNGRVHCTTATEVNRCNVHTIKCKVRKILLSSVIVQSTIVSNSPHKVCLLMHHKSICLPLIPLHEHVCPHTTHTKKNNEHVLFIPWCCS